MLENDTNKVIGNVEWFDEKKGFGVINANDNQIFAHHSEIQVNNNIFKYLKENEMVEFVISKINDTKSNKSKMCAVNITGVNGNKLYCEINEKIDSNKKKNKKKKPKNTETFEPSHEIADMNIRIAPSNNINYNYKCSPSDITVANHLFCSIDDISIYNSLIQEIKQSKIDQNNLWKLWHGDTHLIADDHLNWKEECPTFNMVIEKIKIYFNMNIKATRLNWYKDSSQWKPFHHDAAAVKPHIAKIQNWTVGVSFGSERDIAFEHSKSKTTISLPQPNGSLYAFGNKVNIDWKHGIPQIPPEKQHNDGRISIIAWGWVNME